VRPLEEYLLIFYQFSTSNSTYHVRNSFADFSALFANKFLVVGTTVAVSNVLFD
jgi:hypothetical protein